ncbi:ABC1 kinase family protein [Sporosalibacterium faouarense]|uniref:ABC1 kinase family protein n=1 Tax=Sporosalibacterium faouarense TaxID=516123 RepID=UPI00192A8110|nr:AarF/UbiB family protein [Sporosalibacterium faouarense]
MKVKAIGKRYKNLRRYREIWRILFKYGFSMITEKMDIPRVFSWFLFKQSKRLSREYTRSQRIRMAIEELGPTFVKLGQILSTRYDILPPDIVNELSYLQDSASKFQFKNAKEILEKELGKSIEEIFEEFDPDPIAAASIGQVYRGKLKDGQWVVVKIQRPNIKNTIERDLDILFDISQLVDEHYNKESIIKFRDIVKEFSFFIRKELDYTYEALNCRKFREIYKKNSKVVIPEIYWEYTSKKVLVMEKIDGIKFSNIGAIEDRGWDKGKLAKLGADIFMNQIFVHSFFHGDPHPGNILVINENKIALIDFGIVGYLDKVTLDFITNLLRGGVNKNIDKIIDSLYRMNALSKDTDEIDLRKDLYYILNYYYNIPIRKLNFSEMLNEVLMIAFKHKIQAPSQLTLLIKSIITIEGTGKRLDPDFNLTDISSDVLKAVASKRLDVKENLGNLGNYFIDNIDNIKAFPRTMNRILDKVEKNQVKITMNHEGLEGLKKEINIMTNKVSLSLMISALIVGSSIVIQSSNVPQIFGVSLFGFIGFGISGILGIYLIFSILFNIKKNKK